MLHVAAGAARVELMLMRALRARHTLLLSTKK